MYPGPPQPFQPYPGPSRRPGWARKRVLIPGVFLTWFFGFALGTTGASGSAPEAGPATSPTPRPTATTTVTETAAPGSEPTPTVTQTRKVKVRTTVTVTVTARAHGTGGSGSPADSAPGSGTGGSGSVHYGNCSEARAAGAAPVHRGEPGYSRRLDRDGDGVGCDV